MGNQLHATLLKRRALVAALLVHTSITKAAEVAGVSRNTASKWLKDPDFKAELNRARDHALKKFVEKLHRSAGDMLDVLTKIANNKAEPVDQRVKCAKAVVELALKTADEKFMGRVKKWQSAIGDHGDPAPAPEPKEPEPKADALAGKTREELEKIARPEGVTQH